MNQGRWKEAEKLEVQVVETMKRVLGPEHPDTLNSMNNLAHTYYAENRTAEAISLMQYVADQRTEKLGTDHPSTLNSAKALGIWIHNMNTIPGQGSEG
jgi:hypothetical protein